MSLHDVAELKEDKEKITESQQEIDVRHDSRDKTQACIFVPKTRLPEQIDSINPASPQTSEEETPGQNIDLLCITIELAQVLIQIFLICARSSRL